MTPPQTRRIYLDTSVIIGAVEPKPVTIAFDVLALAGRRELVTSELSLHEALVMPLRRRVQSPDRDVRWENERLRGWYEANLSSESRFFTMTAVSRDVLSQAAVLRAEIPSMKAPDAIHLASALLSACTDFVTGDRRLRTQASSLSKTFGAPLRAYDLDEPALIARLDQP